MAASVAHLSSGHGSVAQPLRTPFFFRLHAIGGKKWGKNLLNKTSGFPLQRFHKPLKGRHLNGAEK